MATSRSTNFGALTSSDGCDATNYNESGADLIGYDEITANSSTTNTTTLVSEFTAQPVNAGRLIKIEADLVVTCTGPTGFHVLFQEDGVDIVRREYSTGTGSLVQGVHPTGISHSPSAGNHNYRTHVGITGSSGESITLTASGTTTNYVYVYDESPDF